jgi:hypothetical protein
MKTLLTLSDTSFMDAVKKKIETTAETIDLENNYEYVTHTVNDQLFSNIVSNKSSFIDGPWVAGGSVRKVWFGKSWTEQDIDFFFANQQQFELFCDNIKKFKTTTTHSTQNAITYDVEIDEKKIKIQAIKKNFYKSYHALLTSFDFNISQFVTDGKIIKATASAIRDCQNNIIRANKSNGKAASLRRILKYAAYGFDPEPKLLIDSIGYTDGWFEDEY